MFIFCTCWITQINTLPETNIAMENPPFSMVLPGKMGIFMGYVSFREGKITTKRRLCSWVKFNLRGISLNQLTPTKHSWNAQAKIIMTVWRALKTNNVPAKKSQDAWEHPVLLRKHLFFISHEKKWMRCMKKKTVSRWFKVPFSSPSWRSLNPSKGSLNHPKKVTLNHQVSIFFLKRHVFYASPA